MSWVRRVKRKQKIRSRKKSGRLRPLFCFGKILSKKSGGVALSACHTTQGRRIGIGVWFDLTLNSMISYDVQNRYYRLYYSTVHNIMQQKLAKNKFYGYT